MRAATSAILISAVLALVFSASAGVRAGTYICRLPSGTQTGRSFQLGADGTYGGIDGAIAGSVTQSGRELRFDGGGKDGNRALVISETRIKVSRQVICTWRKPRTRSTANAPDEAPATPERAGAKLIVVKPDLRR
jgi:hypothetical protein